ncbi:MAG: hypothetical protein ACI8XC_002311, partial [Gammaproteobacteria bacterium]
MRILVLRIPVLSAISLYLWEGIGTEPINQFKEDILYW